MQNCVSVMILGLAFLPVPQYSMKFDDEVFLLLRECTSFKVRPQVREGEEWEKEVALEKEQETVEMDN